ncbi:MurR/RpiR family transcriptional regulator [Tropicibacter naphthalenivorans]|uniref:MurPQ operon repressor n=1 Tax=Tropicibacter naphthalenivorans TaxID=441103 RepID=A0A0P1H089_9RHOB|nr:MurR/RpiR family transcriptional regulator [Tropicibacter naphthalenivorans]CUH80970.1 MurPQ operon repressor [Tropicibacter naphthalenivorans]SMC91479.1 transcriptional regulator, RpiR family [Tropicibacter naphthalenivorans]
MTKERANRPTAVDPAQPAPAEGLGDQTLEGRIYRAYPALTRSEQRLADVLLEHQMELPSYTAAELATKAGVSKSTAARLIRTLGYRSYPEAKRAIRNEQFWGSPQGGLSRAEQAPEVSAQRMMEDDLENIRQTLAAIPEARMTEAAGAIANARRVWIIGLRSGHGLGLHIAHYLTLIRGEVHLMNFGSGSLSHDVGSLQEGDLLLVIAFRRRPKILVDMLEASREAGARTLLITDLSAGASARAADMTLRCRTQSPAPFNTFTAAVTLMNCLAWQVHSMRGDAAIDRYRRIDQLVRRLDNVSTPQTPP